MSQPIVCSNSTKIEHLEQEIETITVDDVPFDAQTTSITLNPSDHNSGEDLKYSRGDHTHLLNLSDIELDLKLPAKLVDEAGVVKKVLVEKTLNTITSSTFRYYFKIPYLTATENLITINISLYKNTGTAATSDVSFIKALIYKPASSTPIIILDISLNHAKYTINQYELLSYDDGTKINYYFVLHIENSVTDLNTSMKYSDISSSVGFPADFSYEDMVLTTAPGTMVSVSAFIKKTSSHLDRIKKSGSTSVFVLTDSSTIKPCNSHPLIYPSSASNWASSVEIASGVYAWKYTATD
jgi:hypothetical protein